ncbi:F-box protein [Mesorhizobium huakuii]|uniref:F-box domain-containing protein n=1 Tax=Mesorhizobium huakuii TaxID=28104 RepID=A0A7G6T5U6_9HYPH|nr:F-box protein [Mesorhizobium huakuii]QND62128.1 hypothetical protein HB778_39330 [Mesorhizobium huakuii]
MTGIDERGKAPMAIFSAIEGDITDDSPALPAVGVEGPGQSSRSVVAHTRSEPQASSVSSSRRMRHTSVLDLQQELLCQIAERLSPTDLLSMSQTNQQMYHATTAIWMPQEGRERAIRAQAIWNRLTQDRPGVEDRLAPLLYGGRDPITRGQLQLPRLGAAGELQQRLILLTETLEDPDNRVTALWGFGVGMAGLAPELQQRLVVLAEGLDDDAELCASALESLGAGVAGLDPVLQQRVVVLAEGLEGAEHRASALQGLGAGVAGLAPELQERLVVLAEGLENARHRGSALMGLGAGLRGLAPDLQQRLVVLAEGIDDPEGRVSALWGFGAGIGGLALELQQRLVVLAEGIGDPENRGRALKAFGTGVAALPRELRGRIAALADGLAQPQHRTPALAGLLPRLC